MIHRTLADYIDSVMETMDQFYLDPSQFGDGEEERGERLDRGADPIVIPHPDTTPVPEGGTPVSDKFYTSFTQWSRDVQLGSGYLITGLGFVINPDGTFTKLVAKAGPFFRGVYDITTGMGFMTAESLVAFEDLLDKFHQGEDQDAPQGDPDPLQGESDPVEEDTAGPGGVAFSSTTGLAPGILGTVGKSPGMTDSGNDKTGAWDDYYINDDGTVVWRKPTRK